MNYVLKGSFIRRAAIRRTVPWFFHRTFHPSRSFVPSFRVSFFPPFSLLSRFSFNLSRCRCFPSSFFLLACRNSSLLFTCGLVCWQNQAVSLFQWRRRNDRLGVPWREFFVCSRDTWFLYGSYRLIFCILKFGWLWRKKIEEIWIFIIIAISNFI